MNHSEMLRPQQTGWASCTLHQGVLKNKQLPMICPTRAKMCVNHCEFSPLRKVIHCWTRQPLHSQGSLSQSHCWRPNAFSSVGRSRASAAPYKSLCPNMERAMRRVLQMLSDIAPCCPRGPRLFCCICKASRKCSTASLSTGEHTHA